MHKQFYDESYSKLNVMMNFWSNLNIQWINHLINRYIEYQYLKSTHSSK